jgi:outer membrane protein
VGLGVISENSPYRGVGSDTKAIPVLIFENRHVRLPGPNLDLKLPAAGPVSLAPTAKYANNGYKATDAAGLQGMAERKDGFWLGAKARWDTPWAVLSAGILGDASSRSGGQQFKLEAAKGFGLAPPACAWRPGRA